MAIRKILEKLKGLSKFQYATTQGQVNRAIKKFIKDRKLIITGSRALNAQAHFPYQRAARDYDVLTETSSKPIAKKLDKILDKIRGGDYHYVKPAAHKETNMLMDIGFDLKRGTRDDFELASLTRIPRKRFKTIKKNATIYAHLDELEKAKARTLKFKKYAYRHKKDRADLETIKILKKKGGLFFK